MPPDEEPDYRFSLANERTFLAWIRTALALLAGGVALNAIDLAFDPRWQRGIAAALIVLGLVTAGFGWRRWTVAERAMREGSPLPTMVAGLVMTGSLMAIAVVLLILTL